MTPAALRIINRLETAVIAAASRADDDTAPDHLRARWGERAATLRDVLAWVRADLARVEAEAVVAARDWDARCEMALDGVGDVLVIDTDRGQVEVAMG